MTTLDLDRFATDNNITTNERLVFALRQVYTSVPAIASLVSTKLISADPERIAYCDRELASFFDDLGNSFQDSFDGVRNAISNGDLLATKPTSGDLRGVWSGMPAIVLGAGPGASVRWDAIKASRGHAILIVCDVMLVGCLERGIVPDFVAAVERVPQIYDTIKGLPCAPTALLCPMVVERRVVDEFGARVIWCWRGGGIEHFAGPQVPRNNFGRSSGTVGIGAALLAGCSPVYLVGHDLCMQGDKTHAAGAHTLTESTKDWMRDQFDDNHIPLPGKAMSGRDVTTIGFWQLLKRDIEYIAKEHPAQTVINTGDGLQINATSHGELPSSWGETVTIPTINPTFPVKNLRKLLPIMLSDITSIDKRCREIIAADVPDAERCRLTTMVDPETAGIWAEIYGSTYAAALIRLHLQPEQHHAMLKRVANTVLQTLPNVRASLEAIA